MATTKIIRESICERLRASADRLSAAPAETKEAAQRRPDHHSAHQAGALEQTCRNEAAVIRDLLRLLETAT